MSLIGKANRINQSVTTTLGFFSSLGRSSRDTLVR